MLKIGSETARDRKDDLTDSVQWKGVGDLFPFNHAESEDFSLGVTQMLTEEASSNSLTDKTAWIDKEYSDNSVSQNKLPERVLCYNNGASLSANDICLVDSSQLPQKCSMENADASEKPSSGFESSATNSNTHFSSTIKENTASMPQDLESALVEDTNLPWNLSEVHKNSNTGEQIKIDVSHQMNSLGQLIHLRHSFEVPNQENPTKFDISEEIRQNMEQQIVEEVVEGVICSGETVPLDIAESEESSKRQDNPNISTSEFLDHSENEVASSNIASSRIEENLVNNKMKIGETDIDSTSHSTMAIDRKESQENIQSKHAVQIHHNNAVEDTNSDGATTSARSSLYQKDHSDLNLQSGPFYLSDPKTSSAHIAYSGSISLRSDSSTTSTRSFAFPVLQSEWNTSPVKMAKANRRRLRTGICCCKFW